MWSCVDQYQQLLGILPSSFLAPYSVPCPHGYGIVQNRQHPIVLHNNWQSCTKLDGSHWSVCINFQRNHYREIGDLHSQSSTRIGIEKEGSLLHPTNILLALITVASCHPDVPKHPPPTAKLHLPAAHLNSSDRFAFVDVTHLANSHPYYWVGTPRCIEAPCLLESALLQSWYGVRDSTSDDIYETNIRHLLFELLESHGVSGNTTALSQTYINIYKPRGSD